MVPKESFRRIIDWKPIPGWISRRERRFAMSDRKPLRLVLLVMVTFAVVRPVSNTMAADGYTPFAGEKTSWHEGFDGYDFIMDYATCAITPMKTTEKEVTSFGIDATVAGGKCRCVVIVP
jgi:hypothetical protein